jgi:hypothetical protein
MDEQKNREIKKTRKKLKKSNREKKPIKIFKKPAGSIRFYKPKTEKTNRIGPKLKKTEPNQKTEPNRFEPVFVLKKPNRNRSV